MVIKVATWTDFANKNIVAPHLVNFFDGASGERGEEVILSPKIFVKIKRLIQKGGDIMAKFEKWISEEGLLQISAWARDGLSEKDIASNMGVAYSTFNDWKKRFSELSEVLKKSKAIADIIVENALYQNATGYSYVEQVSATKKEVFYKDGKREKEIVTPIALDLIRHKPPETTAQIYWLKNRKPSEWRDKREPPSDNDKPDVLQGLLAGIERRKSESKGDSS